jgi:hypothetical protein
MDFQNSDFRTSATQLDHDWDQDRDLLGSKIIYYLRVRTSTDPNPDPADSCISAGA